MLHKWSSRRWGKRKGPKFFKINNSKNLPQFGGRQKFQEVWWTPCNLHLSCSNTRSFNHCTCWEGTHTSERTRSTAVGYLTHCTTAGTPNVSFTIVAKKPSKGWTMVQEIHFPISRNKLFLIFFYKNKCYSNYLHVQKQ